MNTKREQQKENGVYGLSSRDGTWSTVALVATRTMQYSLAEFSN